MLLRQGIRKYREASQQVADAKITGLAEREFGVSRQLVAGAGSGLYERQSDGSWSAIHGTHSLTADTRIRWQPYWSSDTGWLIGTNGVDVPFKWDGVNDIQPLGAGAPSDQEDTDVPPARARDIAEFEGRLFACNTPADPAITVYSDDTSEFNFPAVNHFHCSRESEAMAVQKFSDGILLVFHRRSVHRILFHPVDTGYGAAYFYHEPIDSRRGTISTDSVVIGQNGRCYFADTDGIYELTRPDRPARLISRPLTVMWESLKPESLSNIQAFNLGRRGEICFLVTGINEPLEFESLEVQGHRPQPWPSSTTPRWRPFGAMSSAGRSSRRTRIWSSPAGFDGRATRTRCEPARRRRRLRLRGLGRCPLQDGHHRRRARHRVAAPLRLPGPGHAGARQGPAQLRHGHPRSPARGRRGRHPDLLRGGCSGRRAAPPTSPIR